jgi:hypothetical protein
LVIAAKSRYLINFSHQNIAEFPCSPCLLLKQVLAHKIAIKAGTTHKTL